MRSPGWKPGDRAIYLKQKNSTVPGPRAKDVFPATTGETYNYLVEKYWVVEEILADGRLRLRTRRGKRHVVTVDDPRLRHARWWERLLLGSRFPTVEESHEDAD